MKSKKMVSLICIVSVLLFTLVGCGNNSNSNNGGVVEESGKDLPETEGQGEPVTNLIDDSLEEEDTTYHVADTLDKGVQASFDNLEVGDELSVVYMPPATEFNYYMAIGKGIELKAAELGVKYTLLAPQSGSDVDGQMKMLEKVIEMKPNAIIMSTHDENAAAPLIKKAVDLGIEIFIVNSDILSFPTPIHGVIGFSQRKAQKAMGEYVAKLMDGKEAVVGMTQGVPGWHATERAGGFKDGIEGHGNFKVVAELPGEWNAEGGKKATLQMLEEHPEINVIVSANDYEVMGAQQAAASLGREDIVFVGNDGDTACLEEIAAGKITATANTTPFLMGQVALQVAIDGLHGKFKGGFVETPSEIADSTNILEYLEHPDRLYPAPSKEY